MIESFEWVFGVEYEIAGAVQKLFASGQDLVPEFGCVQGSRIVLLVLLAKFDQAKRHFLHR